MPKNGKTAKTAKTAKAVKTAKAAKAAKTTPVDPVIKDVAELLAEKNTILDLRSKGEDFHILMGASYNHIVDKKLAEASGYAHARDFFAKELAVIPQSTLSLYGAVAKAFTEANAKSYGVSKLGVLLEYENLAHAGPVTGDPGKAVVHVPLKDGTTENRLFSACTVSDLNNAVKQLKGTGEPKLPEADAKRLQALQFALDSAVGDKRVVLKAKIRGRSTVVSLDNIPLAQLAIIVDALASA